MTAPYIPGPNDQPRQYYGAQATYPQKKSRKGVTIFLSVILSGMVLLCIGLGAALVNGSSDSGGGPTVLNLPSTDATKMDNSHGSKPVNTAGTKAPKAVTVPEGTWHVGTDLPAGTYRVSKAVSKDDYCYWEKTKDAEGTDIIANANVTGGMPQVTLKAGQWFTTEGCGDWVKR